MKIFEWILSVLVAIILLQTLYFKFTAQPESVYIFETVGMEPHGRIGSGIVELIAGILILIPIFRVYGAILSVGVISGAIFFHLTKLGIEVKGDGGQLFYYALFVFIASLIILVIRRKQIPIIGSKL
ncbi:MAG: putative oxidoreductase [Cyclobacteriaceae bacterium]|jgi:putative oxidoreductase